MYLYSFAKLCNLFRIIKLLNKLIIIDTPLKEKVGEYFHCNIKIITHHDHNTFD